MLPSSPEPSSSTSPTSAQASLSVAQPSFTLGLRADKDLKDYFISSQASCLVDEESQDG